MIRLQIAVSNLKPTNYQEEPVDQISIKFGPITISLQLIDGHGGKSFFLQFTQAQMLQIYQFYACGLFIQNRKGKYFSLLNLQEIKLNDRIVCQQIYFWNDARQTKFKCEFSIASQAFNNPKVPDLTKMQERENTFNSLKKPMVPKQQTSYNNFIATEENKVPNTFLYGNRLSKTQNTFKNDNLKTLKEGLRKQNEVKSSLQKSKHKLPQKTQQLMSKKSEIKYEEEQDLFVDNPPMMEFTNDQQANQQLPLKVPQIEHIQYADSLDQNSKNRKNPKLNSTQPKFATFNRNGSDFKERGSPQTPSQFQLVKTQNVNLPPKPRTLSKEQIKKLAKKEAEEKEIKDNVMVPIVRGDKFQLVPLSKLKPQQIIEYVQRQRKNEEDAQAIRLQKERLQKQQKQMQQKNKKLQLQIEKRQKQRASLERQASQKKKYSLQSKQSYTGLIKEQKQSEKDEQSQQNNQNQDDYMSDFQSVTGSVIKSRISSRGGNYKNTPKQQESAGLQDEYSQEFDSYSHSALSKTNLNRNKAPSISDYSDSYRSISQSYGKH